jgi:hypothetical protein
MFLHYLALDVFLNTNSQSESFTHVHTILIIWFNLSSISVYMPTTSQPLIQSDKTYFIKYKLSLYCKLIMYSVGCVYILKMKLTLEW